MSRRPAGWLRLAGRWLWPAWLTANLRIVLAMRVAMSAARALSGVVIALYLATQGFSAVAIGAAFVAVSVASAVMSAGVGVLADRLGRQPFLVLLSLLACAAAVGFATVREPVLLVLFAALGTFGRGTGAGDAAGPYQPAESALLADSTPPRRRTAAFARLMFCSTLGTVLGAVLANLVQAGHTTGPAAFAAYRPAFVAMAILAGLAAIVGLAIREPRPRARQVGGRLVLPTRSWPVLWRLWVTNAVNGVGMGMAGPFMSYWLFRRFGVGPGTIGLLFAVANVASLASVLTAPRAARLGTIRAIVVIRVVQAALLVALAWAPTFAAASAIYLARLLVSRVGLPLRHSYVQGVAAGDERARVAGLSRLPAQGTQTGGQLVAGYLFQQASLAAPFTLAGLVQVVNAALYAGLLGRFRPEWEREPTWAAGASAGTVPVPEHDDSNRPTGVERGGRS